MHFLNLRCSDLLLLRETHLIVRWVHVPHLPDLALLELTVLMKPNLVQVLLVHLSLLNLVQLLLSLVIVDVELVLKA